MKPDLYKPKEFFAWKIVGKPKNIVPPKKSISVVPVGKGVGKKIKI